LSFVWVSLCGVGFPSAHISDVLDLQIMEPLASKPPELVQITIPRWIYNRIAVLLIAAQGGAKVEDYIVAVLKGHMRRLNL